MHASNSASGFTSGVVVVAAQSPPLAATNFLVNWLWDFGVRSKEQLQPDKFENAHYQFAE